MAAAFYNLMFTEPEPSPLPSPPLVRTDPGHPTAPTVDSKTVLLEDKSMAPETKILWLRREDQDVKSKPDGVIVLPYSEGNPCDAQPVCFYFCLDHSGSMDTKLVGKEITRWNMACQLFQRVIQDLIASGRKEDKVTIVTFSSGTHVVCENFSVESIQKLRIIEGLTNHRPDGNTNIQLANTTLHTLMINNPFLIQGTHRAAELFFTDGYATIGFQTPTELCHQKTQAYKDLAERLKLKTPIFLWCGAISDAANWNLVRSMSTASEISMWKYIKDGEMYNFAAEVGGVVTTITNMRTFTLPGLPTGSKDRNVLLLPETDNMYYCTRQPSCLARSIVAPALITLCKIRSILETKQNDVVDPLVIPALEDMLTRATTKTRLMDEFVRTSVKWSKKFDTLQMDIITDINHMIHLLKTTGRLDMDHQVSGTRDAYTHCPVVAKSQNTYAQLFQ